MLTAAAAAPPTGGRSFCVSRAAAEMLPLAKTAPGPGSDVKGMPSRLSQAAGAAGTARCRFAAVADAGACNHTLSQPHDFIRMAVHSQGPSVKGEKAIPEKSPAERPGGGACLPPFPPPSEAPALSPPASDGSPAASPPAAHRPDQGQCVLCGPTALRTRPTTPTRTSEAGRRRDYRQLRSYKKAIPEKITY